VLGAESRQAAKKEAEDNVGIRYQIAATEDKLRRPNACCSEF
jgi:hypothetical protein